MKTNIQIYRDLRKLNVVARKAIRIARGQDEYTEVEKAEQRVKVKAFFDGQPPYDVEQLRQASPIKSLSNANWMTKESRIVQKSWNI